MSSLSERRITGFFDPDRRAQAFILVTPDRGIAVPVIATPFRIGSGLDNDLVIRRRGVAPTHAIVEAGPEGLAIRPGAADAEVILNGVVVRAAEPGVLHSTAVVRLGGVTLDILTSLHAAPAAMLRPEGAQQALSGRVTGILDTLHLVHGLGRSGRLMLASADGLPDAHLWLQSGRIIAADCGTFVGSEAVLRLVERQFSDFRLLLEDEMPAPTITEGTLSLLLEMARLCDERSRPRASGRHSAARSQRSSRLS